MEAAADRAWEMRQKFDLQPGVFVNVTTPENAVTGVWLGKGGADKANCYNGRSAGEAKTTYTHLEPLSRKGLVGMIYTDLCASLQRSSNGGSARLREFVTECGAAEIFCADDVDAEDVSLALCASGAASDSGVVQIVLPVYCSKAGTEVTMRLLTCETAASSYFTCFSSTFCDRSRAGRHGRGAGRGVLREDVRGRRRHDRWKGESPRAVPSDGPDLRRTTSFK